MLRFIREEMDDGDLHCGTSQRRTLIVVGIVMTSLGLLVMATRVYLWFHRHRKQGLDDLFMWVAWVFSILFMIMSYLSVRWGAGCKADSLPPSWAMRTVKFIYFIEIFYLFSIFFIKLSITCLYLRLAGALRTRFWKATVAFMVVLVLQFSTTIIIIAVQCRPIRKYWDPTVEGTCVSISAFFYSTNIFTIVSDCVMLALPIPILWSINRPRNDKIALLAAFLLGFVSTVMSCIRLYSIHIYTMSPEPAANAAPINTWSFVEINLGVLCASGPALKSLIRRRDKTSHSAYPMADEEQRLPCSPKAGFSATHASLAESRGSAATCADSTYSGDGEEVSLAPSRCPPQT